MQLSEVVEDRIQYKIKLEEQRQKLETLVCDNILYKEKQAVNEEEIRTLKTKILTFEKQDKYIEELKEEIQIANKDQEWSNTLLKSKDD